MRKTLWIAIGSALVSAAVFAVAVHALGAQARVPRFLHPPRPPTSTQGFPRGRNRLSPHESVEGEVDGAHIAVVYGRPSMRGRKIFGGLVPFDHVWCPGADEATTFESTREVLFGALRVPPGPHTIWVRPSRDEWTLIVSRDPSGFHTFHDPSADLGEVSLQKRELPSAVEQLTFAIEKASRGGVLSMAWETTEVSAPFRVVQ